MKVVMDYADLQRKILLSKDIIDGNYYDVREDYPFVVGDMVDAFISLINDPNINPVFKKVLMTDFIHNNDPILVKEIGTKIDNFKQYAPMVLDEVYRHNDTIVKMNLLAEVDSGNEIKHPDLYEPYMKMKCHKKFMDRYSNLTGSDKEVAIIKEFEL